MLFVFTPIFVADTKVIYGYHFVDPLTLSTCSFEKMLVISL